MAKCESKDLGLYERFHACEIAHEKVSMHWAQIRRLLSDRIMYMVYEENIAKGKMNDGYIMDVFLGYGMSTIGIEIASSLRTMIPFCHYPNIGRPIIITDYPDLEKVPQYIKWDAGWVLNPDAEEFQPTHQFLRDKVETYAGLKAAVFQDLTFLVILEDSGKKVHMRIYKK